MRLKRDQIYIISDVPPPWAGFARYTGRMRKDQHGEVSYLMFSIIGGPAHGIEGSFLPYEVSVRELSDLEQEAVNELVRVKGSYDKVVSQ